MDLYEALKSGVSEAELLEGFNKDLTEAKEKIKKEIEKEKAEKEAREEKIRKARLAEYRDEIAAALCDYLNLVLNISDTDDDVISQTEIEEILKDFEKNLDNLSFFVKLFDKSFNKDKDKDKEFKIPFKSWTLFDDDQIIKDFIKTL